MRNDSQLSSRPQEVIVNRRLGRLVMTVNRLPGLREVIVNRRLGRLGMTVNRLPGQRGVKLSYPLGRRGEMWYQCPLKS